MASNKKVYMAGNILKPVQKRVGKWAKEQMPHILLLEILDGDTDYPLWKCLHLETGIIIQHGQPTLDFYYELHQ